MLESVWWSKILADWSQKPTKGDNLGMWEIIAEFYGKAKTMDLTRLYLNKQYSIFFKSYAHQT